MSPKVMAMYGGVPIDTARKPGVESYEHLDETADQEGDYKRLLEQQRKRLLEGDDDSSSESSGSSVFDPFQSK